MQGIRTVNVQCPANTTGQVTLPSVSLTLQITDQYFPTFLLPFNAAFLNI